jgi:hypothetical protein
MSQRMIRCGGCGTRKPQSGTSFVSDGTTRVRSCSTACDAIIIARRPAVIEEAPASSDAGIVTLTIGKPYTAKELRQMRLR